MEVYLIRHTTPDVKKGICYGQTDLNIKIDTFKDELEYIKSNLPKDIDCFYSSTLKRCSILAEHLSPVVNLDERLKELNFGRWENKSWDEISSTELNLWMQDFVNVNPPDGENYINLHQRTINFIDDILERSHKKIAIVTHAGNIRSILSYILDLALENSFRIQLSYASVSHVFISKEKELSKLISIK